MSPDNGNVDLDGCNSTNQWLGREQPVNYQFSVPDDGTELINYNECVSSSR